MTDKMFDVLQKACLAAAKIQTDYFEKEIEISTKESPTDFVTEVDLKSQEAIVSSLTSSMLGNGQRREDFGFISEEGIADKAPNLFIIDPLDGTSAYIDGINQFCITIAYAENGEVKAGIVHDPLKKVTYFAQKNEGAYKYINGEKTSLLIKEVALDKAIFGYNTTSDKNKGEEVLKIILKLIHKVGRIRENRSIALAVSSTADNKYQVQMHGRGRIWDIAAAKLILNEAGGIMTDWQGKELEPDLEDIGKRYEILSTHKDLLPQVVDLINS